jgi:hypothetical protein
METPICASRANEQGLRGDSVVSNKMAHDYPGGIVGRVVVGLMVTDRNDYYEALQAQAYTWLQDIPSERTCSS